MGRPSTSKLQNLFFARITQTDIQKGFYDLLKISAADVKVCGSPSAMSHCLGGWVVNFQVDVPIMPGILQPSCGFCNVCLYNLVMMHDAWSGTPLCFLHPDTLPARSPRSESRDSFVRDLEKSLEPTPSVLAFSKLRTTCAQAFEVGLQRRKSSDKVGGGSW